MATVDNSTQVVISTESGTGWSVDVTNANLDPLLTLKDFTVKFDGVVQSNVDFTKTSQTIITYNGVALGSPTEVVIARDTPNERVKELTFGDRLQSAEYEAEFNRVHKLINENEISGADNVKVTVADTTPGTLEDKIAEGADVLISVLNPGANEQLQISVSSPTSEPYVDINSALVVPDAVGTNTIAIGGGVTADGSNSVVLGTNSFTDNANFATDDCIVIGNGANISPTTSDSSDSIAIGNGASVTNVQDGIAIGSNADSAGQGGIAIGDTASANGSTSIAIGSNVVSQVTAISIGQSSTTSARSISIGRNVSSASDAVSIGDGSDATGALSVALGNDAQSNNTSSVAIGDSAIASANNAIQLGAGTNSTASTLQFLGNTLADANGLSIVNQDITSGTDITVTPGTSNDRLFITPTANINLILLTAGAVNTTHFTFVNLDPGSFSIDVKIDLVGNPTILTLGGGLTNVSVGYTGTDYRFYG